MSGSLRDQKLLQVLRTAKVASVQHLVDALGVSEPTVRRDLARLEGVGLLRRVRGGAEVVETANLRGQPAFEMRQNVRARAKRAIAERAAALVEDRDAIIIDGGTTTYLLAEFLVSSNVTVLTNSLPVGSALLEGGSARVTLTGGAVYRDQGIMLSPFEQAVVTQFAAKYAFFGAQAISPSGLMQTDPLLIRAERELFARAEMRVALVDSSKFERTGGHVLCSLPEVHTLITDSDIKEASRRMLESAGVHVVVVDVPQAGLASAS